MAPLSLRIVQDGGAVTRKMKLDPSMSVAEATRLVNEKANLPPEAKAYGLFLRSMDSIYKGIWMEADKKLSDYVLRDGDQVEYITKIRNLKVRMLDDTVKTFKVDQSKYVGELLLSICAKIGITNHEEYGMCIEECDEADEALKAGSTGTLTARMKSKLEERDLEFEQLSKKLKTDDNVDWIDPHITLSEVGVAPLQTLLLKRKLFYSDRNVDSRDPVQLNLLYNQARDNILHGRHPVTVEKAAEFAGIQCQIQFGDYNEEKHKPGFIENLREYLPEQYCSSWGMEKNILKEYSSRGGLNELDAKHLYTKNARELPTYGVTFFLVKERQKGKKKLVPRLLGISSENILRLDETSKVIIQSWPLTHIKTYNVGKSETFTLDFGDYSDKPYCVKTCEAFRIRDILEGYIDLIQRRKLAGYNIAASEHGYMGQECVASGQANMMQHIANNPSKLVQHSVVGPSRILDHVPGQRVSGMGTQICTAQQLVIAEMKNKQEKSVLKADVSTRKDMGIPFTRRLNRLNSNSVMIVNMLTGQSEEGGIENAHKIAKDMEADMPSIRDGVAKTIEKQNSEEERMKLQDQLEQLEQLLRSLVQHTGPDTANPAEAEDTAKQVVNLCTEMYFGIAPESKRRSSLLKSTRGSFIADERTEKNLRRASFIAATATTNHALENASELVAEEYRGPALSPQQIKDLERDAVDKLGKINAAIAHYLLAHSDPKNIDYSAAVNSLNTIHELVPELARDGQILACVRDDKDRAELVADIQELCAAAKQLCSLSGVEDPQKLQEVATKYADVSGKLVYVFGKRGGKARADKENQIIDLTEKVVDKTNTLLNSAQALAHQSPTDPAAIQVNDAGAVTAQAAKHLMTQTTLNAPTIDEPHCKSALTAASEALASSAQHLAATWKPLVEHPSRHIQGEKLHHQAMELAKALDDLTEVYAGDEKTAGTVSATKGSSSSSSVKPVQDAETQRLKFINSLANVGGKWRTFEEDLDKPLHSAVSKQESLEAERRLSDKLGQLNAAVASLLAATTDHDKPDYKTAETAVALIDKLMPDILKDAKIASANQDEASKAALLANIKELCATTQNICASAHGADPEALNDALSKYTDASGRLTYAVNRRADPDRESEIIDATSAACGEVGALLSSVQLLSEAVPADTGEELDARGAAVADAARGLFTVAQVTSSSISDPRCQSTLLSAVDKVSSASDALEQAWKPLAGGEHQAGVAALARQRKALEQLLERVRELCQVPDDDMQQRSVTVEGPMQPQRMQLTTTLRGARDQLAEAQHEFNKPATPAKGTNMEAVQHRLDQGLAQLNAAMATLLAATADHNNPDCATAQQATDTITKLMPQLIKDTKTLSTGKEESARAAMLAEIKALCDASQNICASAYGDDAKAKNDAVAKFADSSEKLVFVYNPRKRGLKTNKESDLVKASCTEASALLSGARALAQGVGGARGRELDARAALLEAQAQALQHATQILGPSLQSAQSQEALLSSISSLEDAAKSLQTSVEPLKDDHKHGAKAKDTILGLKKLQEMLDQLKAVCSDLQQQRSVTVEGPMKPQRIQLISTMRGAQDQLAEAQQEFNKPATPAKGTNMEAVQHRLDQGLAQLNTAMATLLAATADHNNPDCATAQQATETITKLMPQLIKDTKTLSTGKEESARAAMLAEIKALCDASQSICASAYGDDAKAKNDAVAKFAESSEKLVFVYNPRKRALKTNKESDLVKASCTEGSALLGGVHALAQGVGGARGRELDARAALLEARAQALQHATQILGPSLQSAQSQEALLSSISSLEDAAKSLQTSVEPLKDDHKHGAKAKDTILSLQKLQDMLDQLKAVCSAPGTQDSQEQEKLQFIKSLEANKGKWADVKELNKPVAPSRGGDTAATEARLFSRLAALDAAIASLLAHTQDKEKPSYGEAEKSVKNISELLPLIVQDTKTVSASKDESARAVMLSEIKALCDASEKICSSSYGDDTKGMNEAVAKYSQATGKLVFIANPRLKQPKVQQVLEQAQSACGDTAALLAGVQQLSEAEGGARGRALDAQVGALADAAQNMLRTAQITSSSLSTPESRSALLASVARTSEAASHLARSLDEVGGANSGPAQQLSAGLQRLLAQLDGMKKICERPAETGSQDPDLEEQKLHFINTLEASKGKWAEVEKELKKPVPPSRGADTSPVEQRLGSRIAALDAAIAALLASTADKEKPSYAEAEKSVKTVTDLLPQIVQDTKTVCNSKEEVARAAMLAEIKALCDSSQSICASACGDDAKGVNEAVAKYSEASGKLMFVANPRVNKQKEIDILNQAQSACAGTAGLLAGVQTLSEAVGGPRGRALDAQGGALADAAQNMLRTAQITSTSLSTPASRAAMLSSIESMQAAANPLLAELQGTPAATELQSLLEQLELMKTTCNAPDTAPPLPSSKPPPLPRVPPPASHSARQTQEFLDRLRMEEGLACSEPMSPASISQTKSKVKPAPPIRKTDVEKIHCPVFIKSLEDAGKSIKAHESSIMKQCRSPSSAGAALSHRDMMTKQTQLQQNLVLAGVEVAHLVDANYADKVDYSAGLKSTKALPQLMTSIVEDGTQLADNLNDMARKAFLYDMLQLCESGGKICEAGLSDRQKLNDAAVNFGDTSTKLLYMVSSDVDPALEKEIISRAKEIGDSVSRLAQDAGNVASAGSAGGNAGSVQHICDAGTACVDAAGKLVYTAKLTAPSIHETPCQEALVASTEALSNKLEAFKDSWTPLQTDAKQAKTISHLNTEAAQLEDLVRALRSDVAEGALVKKRREERLVVEDTPIRQLATKILEEARYHTECPSSSPQDKISYASYTDKVSDAIRTLDIANALCKRAPHDTEKRRDLERAVQNLQMMVLQARPSRGDKGKGNIVDLMDFMEEVATEAKNLSSAASTADVLSALDMLALEEIKDKCEKIHSRANKLISGEVDSELDFNDLFDQFGQDCEDTIKKLNADVKGMEDTKSKRLLQSKVMALSESCNMLRFATKSGISTEACCSLDAALDELDDIEARLIPAVVQHSASDGVTMRVKKQAPSTLSPATMRLCREVTSSKGVAAPSVTAYITDAAARSDGSLEDTNKLLKHLYKLVHLLKTQTVSGTARAATWQTGDGPLTARVTEQILQEIYNPESQFGVKPDDKKQKILEEDVVKLLVPSAPMILGDKKQQEDNLTVVASQLSATCSDLSQSVSRDTSGDSSRELSQLARVAVDQARELDGIARGVHITDPVQRRRIDEAAKEMSFATYNVLKTAESACLEPKNANLKRRLADALQNLNHSIDKLVHHSSTSPVLYRACGALSRAAAAQLAGVRPRATSAAPFAHTCDLMESQGENISKLKSEQPVPRKEFMRTLDDIGTAVRTSVDCAEQCAYYIAVSDKNKDLAKSGLVDVPHIQKSIESIQDTCMAVIGCSQIDQAKDQVDELQSRVSSLSSSLEQAQLLVKDGEVKRTLLRARSCVSEAAAELQGQLARGTDMEQVTPRAVSLLEALSKAHGLIECCPLVPSVGDVSTETRAKCDDVINHSKSLLTNTLALIKDVQYSSSGAGKSSADDDDDDEMMTWVSFNTNRKKLLDAYDALLKTVRRNGHRAGIYEKAPEEEENVQTKKSYIEIQVDLANKWLKSPSCKLEVKTTGQQAARNVVDMARQMSEELKGVEREELRGVVSETEQLLAECVNKYDHEKYSVLQDRLKELRKSIRRGVVTRVVEDFIEAEAPLADLDLLTDTEQDESKRKFILERKIASLLAQLGRVTKTARFVANASQQQSINLELAQCSEQTELLAPMLVQAAQQRIDNPDDKVVIEKYKALLAQYAESIAKVRDLCDRAVDPMDFVQTAGETMQRMREDMTQQSTDTQKCAYASSAISRLANRVINVSMSSNAVASDPELQKALVEAKARLHAATPAPDTRASRLPDWRDTTAEILRTTGEVECVLGGENIFKKGPTTANQPIFSVAQSLHESVKEWSSRDNEIVGVARRMAVLMARLSEYMETDKKDALIMTSKSIVAESQEVTELAKKLAHECTDVRIKKNLLQTCERIPTISGQLKMLTAVKASSLGQQAEEEDKEAMDMLVGNAQSLMMSISDVVKAAASASVKIMSQRGPRLRWVRKTYY